MIKTEQDWWELVDRHWINLLSIMHRYLPMSGNQSLEKKILFRPLAVEVCEMKENRDKNIARYFNAAWASAPDHPEIHRIPSWGVLCDLCSEEYVLFESEMTTNETQTT